MIQKILYYLSRPAAASGGATARSSALSIVLVVIPALGPGACQGFDRVDLSRGFSRASWQQPDRVIRELNLAPDAVVADLGAGEGYFATRIARTLVDGKVYAVEVTAERTAKLEAIRVERGLSNLEGVLGAFEDPRLPEAVDLIFLCNTYHHIENQVAYFTLVREKYLKPGGRVATIDHRHDMTGVMRIFLSAGHWSDPAIVVTQMGAAGFTEIDRPDFLANQNFQIFEARPQQAAGTTNEQGRQAE